MTRALLIAFVFPAALVSGCGHLRIVAASNAKDCGESIRTRFRYSLTCGDGAGMQDEYTVARFRMRHPEVFASDGVPILVKMEDTLENTCEINQVTGFFSVMTLGIIPMTTSWHQHRRCTLSVAGRRIGRVDMCAHGDSAVPFFFFIPLPFPMLVFSGDGDVCVASGRKFVEHKYGPNAIGAATYHGIDDKAMAYGIASRLKEAENAGVIDERFVTMMTARQSLSDAANARARLSEDAMARRGAAPRQSSGAAAAALPFEIVRCDIERGKDFAYLFALRRRGGGAATLSDYGVMRSGFRSAIRSRYVAAHPDVNPRTLVIDFTEYALKGGVVSGRVAVLTISPESLSYDSASRRGVLRVRIGDGQFEDARRWMRKNLASLAARGGITASGDAVPQGGRFYSESETMRDGVLEVSFRTE